MRNDQPNFLTCPIEPTGTVKREPGTVLPTDTVIREQLPEHGSRLTSPKRRFRKRWIVLLAVVLFSVATIPAGVSLARAYGELRSAQTSLNVVKDRLTALDVPSARVAMDDAYQSLGDARDAMQGVGFWRDVPWLGTQLRAIEDTAAAGAQTLDGMRNLLNVVEVVTDALQGGVDATGTLTTGVGGTRRYEDLSPEEKRSLLAKFANALPDLRIARDKIDLALELWSRVPQDTLVAPLRSALQPVADTLPKLKQALDEGVPLIEVLVPMAGYPTKMRYLVLLQNADELRPGGGFIGNVGTLTFDAGELTELEFVDVYNIDNPASYAWKETPPQPIIDRLGVTNWYLRDANWSPDFPTSAERQLDFYAREVALGTGRPVANAPTAVLALEPGFFRSLLRLTGPIVVDGKTYNETNFFDQIQYEVEEGFLKQGIPLERRKDLIGNIGDALVAKLKALPASRWNEIVDLTTKALERKQIMAYAREPEILKLLDARGWTARAKPTTGDFLWVIDANLAALKTDGMMDKQVTYALDARDPAHPRATVTLTYRNKTQQIDWRYTRYRSYTRIYVPEGARLISAQGAMKDDRYKTGGVAIPGPVDVTNELGKSVFGAFWSIEPRQTGTLSFTYELPSSAVVSDSGKYRLDWPKQAGADSTTLTLDLSLGKTVQSAVPAEDEEYWGDDRYTYRTDSLHDRQFEVTFK